MHRTCLHTDTRTHASHTCKHACMFWGNTNRVVSNRVVPKGPLYPSKTNIIIIVVFCWAKHPSTQQLPIHISGAGLPPDLQIWLLGTTPFDTTPFICLWSEAYKRGRIKNNKYNNFGPRTRRFDTTRFVFPQARTRPRTII